MGDYYNALIEYRDDDGEWCHLCSFGFINRNYACRFFVDLPHNGLPNNMSWQSMLTIHRLVVDDECQMTGGEYLRDWLTGDERIVSQDIRPDLMLIEDEDILLGGHCNHENVSVWHNRMLPIPVRAMLNILSIENTRMIWWIM